MSNNKPARPIIQGRVGDQFIVAKNYEGNYANAVGVPLNTPHGRAMPIPPGDGPANLTVVTRPDFRSEDKNGPVHPK
ncbi:unnamed protein product [Caenorhabditis nigoni]